MFFEIWLILKHLLFSVKTRVSGCCSTNITLKCCLFNRGLRPDLSSVGLLFACLEVFSHFHSSVENKGLLILAGSS